MRAPSPSFLRLLAVAADLRADGNGWDVVATKVGRRPETCRRWPERYPAEWEQLYEAAEDQKVREARAESRAMLRQQFRKDVPKEMRDAAKSLLSISSRIKDAKAKSGESPCTIHAEDVPPLQKAVDASAEP
jgi:hypothetical protein